MKQVCKYIALLQRSITAIHDSENGEIDISEQRNVLLLKPSEDTCVIESRFVKQRTEFWHVIRDKAPVTGSTIHNALGLRGKKEQAKHIDKVVNKTVEEFPDDVKTRMLYGTANEINAQATFAGIVMPASFRIIIMWKRVAMSVLVKNGTFSWWFHPIEVFVRWKRLSVTCLALGTP